MQKPVKKNLEKNLNKSLIKDTIKRPKLSLTKKIKLTKDTKLKEKQSKTLRFSKHILDNLESGRPFSKYEIQNKAELLKLNVRITPNNVFCTLKDIKSNLVLNSISAGSYKLNVSKKGIRHYSNQIIRSFVNGLREKNIQLNKPLITKIIAPANLRKPVLDCFKNSILKNRTSEDKVFIEIPAKKVFNGCRPCKKIRKKRKGLSLFK